MIIQFDRQVLFQYLRAVREYHHHPIDYLKHPHQYPNVNLIFIQFQYHHSSHQSNSSYLQYCQNLLIIKTALGFQLTE